jgi:hypothetical protein
MSLLSTDIENPEAVPYFLWDDPITVRQFREQLGNSDDSERLLLIAKLLREARDEDVWLFVDPREVFDRRTSLYPLLGRRQAFWRYLLEAWREEGLLG